MFYKANWFRKKTHFENDSNRSPSSESVKMTIEGHFMVFVKTRFRDGIDYSILDLLCNFGLLVLIDKNNNSSCGQRIGFISSVS